jgi:hypothetical protein
MAQYYTSIKNLSRIADFGGGVAVDSRSAPVSR